MDYTSAGTILISFVNRKVLLVKHPEGHWGFPKGFIEKEETAYYAAKGELSEEVGIECNFYLNPNKYSFDILKPNQSNIYYIVSILQTQYLQKKCF